MRGHRGACSRLEIHLQYRPRLFSCLITPCQLKLNNKIYVAQSAPPTSLTSTPLFRAFGIRCRFLCRFLGLPVGRRLVDGWLSRDFHYYDSEILLGATRSLRRYTTRCSRAPSVFHRKILSRCARKSPRCSSSIFPAGKIVLRRT